MANNCPTLRCAIYTRKSSEEGLEQSFNSLDAQREACEAYIQSQRHEGWMALNTQYDDGGFSGGSMNRPALQHLMQDVENGRVDLIVVYKVDRLTRALSDFARLVELFDAKKVSFVSVTQQFNTTTSMGRLTLNVLLSFAQFEREVTGERIRDKIAASKKKGMWMGGRVPIGYDVVDRKLIPNTVEVAQVRHLYERYLALGCVAKLKTELDANRVLSKTRVSRSGRTSGGRPYSRGALYELLKNRLYIGDTMHGDRYYPGEHPGIVPRDLWDKMQEKLQLNLQGHRTGVRANEPSLLVGLVYDAQNRRLTPSHTVKKGKRYRYYVTPARAKTSEHDHATRIPAQDLENLVAGRINAFMAADQMLLDSIEEAGSDANRQKALIHAAHKHVGTWPDASLSGQREFLRRVLDRVTVEEKFITIMINRSALKEALLRLQTIVAHASSPAKTACKNATPIILTVAANLARRGLEVRLIIAGADAKDESSRLNPSLIKAIARGRNWYEQLVSREKVSLTDLAAESGVNNRYASRILRLAFLAPDIVEAILEGRQPIGMTLDKMLDHLPQDWERQRQVLGF